MKNIMKSVFAVAVFTLSLAACTPKEKPAAEAGDSVTVEPVAPAATESTDTTAVPADTTAAH